MQSNHQRWLAARRAQRGEHKLRFAVRVAGNRKFAGTDTHGMQSLGIVEAQEPARNAALGGKLRNDGGNVAAGALHAAGDKHFREQTDIIFLPGGAFPAHLFPGRTDVRSRIFPCQFARGADGFFGNPAAQFADPSPAAAGFLPGSENPMVFQNKAIFSGMNQFGHAGGA